MDAKYSSAQLTLSQLSEMRLRCALTTLGPWSESFPENPALANTPGHALVVSAVGALVASKLSPADAQFVAHARTDVPRLLDEIHRLTSELEAWRALAMGMPGDAPEQIARLRDFMSAAVAYGQHRSPERTQTTAIEIVTELLRNALQIMQSIEGAEDNTGGTDAKSG